MIDITGDGPVQIAIQRAFDVLGCEGAIGAVGYLETQPDDAIAVLRLLEAIETRRNRRIAPLRGTTGPLTAHPAKSQAKRPRWPKRAWRTVPDGWNKGRIRVT
jgi:hypothetical protein